MTWLGRHTIGMWLLGVAVGAEFAGARWWPLALLAASLLLLTLNGRGANDG